MVPGMEGSWLPILLVETVTSSFRVYLFIAIKVNYILGFNYGTCYSSYNLNEITPRLPVLRATSIDLDSRPLEMMSLCTVSVFFFY